MGAACGYSSTLEQHAVVMVPQDVGPRHEYNRVYTMAITAAHELTRVLGSDHQPACTDCVTGHGNCLTGLLDPATATADS